MSKYSDVEQIYSGEIGRLFGVVFVESTEAKVFSQSVYTTVSAHTAGSAVVTLADMPESAVLYLTAGAKINIGTTEYTVASADVAAKTVTLSATVASAIAAGTAVYSEDAGIIDAATKKGMDVHATLVFGADAYGIIDVDGESCLRSIHRAGRAVPRGADRFGRYERIHPADGAVSKYAVIRQTNTYMKERSGNLHGRSFFIARARLRHAVHAETVAPCLQG